MQLDIQQYLSKFKVIYSNTLFEDEKGYATYFYNCIQKKVCPVCNCKLYLSKKGDIYCRSKKHIRRFFMRAEVYKRFDNKNK